MPLEAPSLSEIHVSVKNTFIDCFEEEIEQKPSVHRLGEHTCTARILRQAGYSPTSGLAIEGLRHMLDFNATLTSFCPSAGEETCTGHLESETHTRTNDSDETWSSFHTSLVHLETPCSGLQDGTPTPHRSSQYLSFGNPNDMPKGMHDRNQETRCIPTHDVLEGAPSLGSRFHGKLAQDGSKACDPCVWFWKKGGCTNGTNCKRCHMCPDGEAKIRRKEKMKQKRDTAVADKQFSSSIREAGRQQQVLVLVQGSWSVMSPPPLSQPDCHFSAAR